MLKGEGLFAQGNLIYRESFGITGAFDYCLTTVHTYVFVCTYVGYLQMIFTILHL